MKQLLQDTISKYNQKMKSDIVVTDLPEINFYKSSINNLIRDIWDDVEIIEYTKKTSNEIKMLLHNNELI
jgi:hypothetical protein